MGSGNSQSAVAALVRTRGIPHSGKCSYGSSDKASLARVTSCERNGASRRFQPQYRRLAPSRSQNSETTRFAVFFTWDPSSGLGPNIREALLRMTRQGLTPSFCATEAELRGQAFPSRSLGTRKTAGTCPISPSRLGCRQWPRKSGICPSCQLHREASERFWSTAGTEIRSGRSSRQP